jgi:hypothetical protein
MPETSSAQWKKFWRRFIAEEFRYEWNAIDGPQTFLGATGRDRFAMKCESWRGRRTVGEPILTPRTSHPFKSIQEWSAGVAVVDGQEVEIEPRAGTARLATPNDSRLRICSFENIRLRRFGAHRSGDKQKLGPARRWRLPQWHSVRRRGFGVSVRCERARALPGREDRRPGAGEAPSAVRCRVAIEA